MPIQHEMRAPIGIQPHPFAPGFAGHSPRGKETPQRTTQLWRPRGGDPFACECARSGTPQDTGALGATQKNAMRRAYHSFLSRVAFLRLASVSVSVATNCMTALPSQREGRMGENDVTQNRRPVVKDPPSLSSPAPAAGGPGSGTAWPGRSSPPAGPRCRRCGPGHLGHRRGFKKGHCFLET